jgi:hypothetical protein
MSSVVEHPLGERLNTVVGQAFRQGALAAQPIGD